VVSRMIASGGEGASTIMRDTGRAGDRDCGVTHDRTRAGRSKTHIVSKAHEVC